MRMNLATVGMKLVLSDIEQVFKSETSYMVFSNLTVRSFTHLAMYKEDSVLTLYEFISVPYKLGPGHFMEIVPDEKVIAVNNRNTLYRTMTLLILLFATTSINSTTANQETLLLETPIEVASFPSSREILMTPWTSVEFM